MLAFYIFLIVLFILLFIFVIVYTIYKNYFSINQKMWKKSISLTINFKKENLEIKNIYFNFQKKKILIKLKNCSDVDYIKKIKNVIQTNNEYTLFYSYQVILIS